MRQAVERWRNNNSLLIRFYQLGQGRLLALIHANAQVPIMHGSYLSRNGEYGFVMTDCNRDRRSWFDIKGAQRMNPQSLVGDITDATSFNLDSLMPKDQIGFDNLHEVMALILAAVSA